ncbi:MAG: hypothetical protein FWB86_03195 [Treponema sp.]|nr:hypothetical protein [Treponema sp.]MCL2251112.1 hypothetical protein [Treponema sp.]
MLRKIGLFVIVVLFLNNTAWTQDFGFSFDDTETSAQNQFVSISGEVSAAIIGYFDEMIEGAKHINTRDMFMFSGKLNFSAQSHFAQGVINLKLVPSLVPVSIDEAYIRAFFGDLDVSAGFRKITWGKADQFGPLDIINLPDQSKIFIEMADNNNLNGVKIANPLIHASYRFGQFSKLECVFLPSFEIVSMAISSAIGNDDDFLTLVSGPISKRWIPAEMKKLSQMIPPDAFLMPDTSGLDYAQAGLRFTTTIGSADLGVQYFYGRMFQPAVKFISPTAPDVLPSIEFLFNIYHQIGIDYAQVLAGFNIRAEVAANITEDLKGDDGYIYNPSIGWSFGFDRNIFAGININLQANGSVRLFNDKVGIDDIEAGKPITSTRITTMLSKKFLRDEFELRTAVVWGIEDEDCVIIPALIWMKDDLRAAFSGGFFLGDSNGQLGQYKDNNFLKISVTYIF